MGKSKFKTRCFLDIKIDSQPVGRVIFELFDDICPKATDNFKKLCQGVCGLGLKTGKPLHYQGSVFHRVIKGFMVQGGDFSNGDGTGGESIYGGTFADECLTTPHDRPFLLSMANRGANTNGSQFFITTAPAPHLNGKHVVFGHVISGEDVVRKIESVPIADTKSHRPIKSIVIDTCGELIPVKKKKLLLEGEKETKAKKPKKDKKKKKKKKAASSDESGSASEDENKCSVRAEEIPEVPPPKFLYRGQIESDQKSQSEKKEDKGSRQNSISYETPRSGRTSDHSGRKVKGRGQLRYRSPDARSGSFTRSTTPPHWRQAGSNARRMDEEEWKQWRERRMNEQRNALEEKVSPPHSQRASSKGSRRRDPSLSPSAAATSARNRSPSASPSRMDVDIVEEKNKSPSNNRANMKRNMADRSPSRSSRKSDILQAENISVKNNVLSSPREQNHYREKELNGTRDRYRNSPELSKSDRLANDLQKDYAVRERDSSVGSSIDTIRLMAKRRLIGDYDDDHYNIDIDSRAKSSSSTAERSSKRPVVPEVSTLKSNGSSAKPLNDPTRDSSPPSQRSRRKYAASPTLRSPPKVSASPPARSDNLSEKYRSKSPTLEAPVVQTEQNHSRRISLPSPPHRRLSISPSRSNAELRMPSPPPATAVNISSDIPRKSQWDMKDPLVTQKVFEPSKNPLEVSPTEIVVKSPPESRSVISPARSRSSGQNSSRRERISETQVRRRSPTSNAFTDKQAVQKPSSPGNLPDISRIPLPKDRSDSSRSRSRSASHSDSGSSRKSSIHGSHHSRSRSHSSSRVTSRAPRSPPPHLVQKWRKREELRNQKRRIIPPAAASFGSPDDRSHSRDRRRALGGSPTHSHSVSRSRSRSFSSPRRRHARSSSSRSDSMEGQKPSVVTVNRSQSKHASRSASPPVRSRDRLRSTSGSPRKSLRSKNRGTSPGNPIIMVTRPDPRLQRTTTTITNHIETIPSTSKWEKSPKDLDRNDPSTAAKTWTTSHWQAVSEDQRTKLTRAPATTNTLGASPQGNKVETTVPKRLEQTHLDSDSDSRVSEERVSLAHTATKSSHPSARSDNSMAIETPARSASPASERQPSAIDIKTKKKPVASLRKQSASSSSRSSSSSGSSSSSSRSQSSKHSNRRPFSPRRPSSRGRSRSHSRSRRFQTRSDFSNSHSRGRGSQYTRSSAVSRTYYTRSPSRSFSTRASTNWGTRTSYTSRRRSWSRSRSRSYTHDSRSRSSSRRRYSSRSRHNKRSRRSHRSSSSSRSRSSSRSYTGSSRRRLR